MERVKVEIAVFFLRLCPPSIIKENLAGMTSYTFETHT